MAHSGWRSALVTRGFAVDFHHFLLCASRVSFSIFLIWGQCAFRTFSWICLCVYRRVNRSIAIRRALQPDRDLDASSSMSKSLSPKLLARSSSSDLRCFCLRHYHVLPHPKSPIDLSLSASAPELERRGLLPSSQAVLIMYWNQSLSNV